MDHVEMKRTIPMAENLGASEDDDFDVEDAFEDTEDSKEEITIEHEAITDLNPKNQVAEVMPLKSETLPSPEIVVPRRSISISNSNEDTHEVVDKHLKRIAELQSLLLEYREEKSVLKRRCEVLESSGAEEVKALSERISLLEGLLNQKDTHIFELNKEIDKSEEYQNQLTTTQKKVTEIELDLDKKEDLIRNMQAQLASAALQADKSEHHHVQEKNILIDENSRVRLQLSELALQLEERTNVLESTQSEMIKWKSAFEQQSEAIESLTQEKDSLQNELSLQFESSKDLQAQVEQSHQTLQECQKRIETLEIEKKELQKTFESESEGKLGEFTNQFDTFRREIESLQMSSQSLKDENATLSHSNFELRSELADLKADYEKVTKKALQLKSAYQSNHEMLKVNQKQMEELIARIASNADLSEKMILLEKDLEDSNQQVELYKAELDDLSSRYDELSQRLVDQLTLDEEIKRLEVQELEFQKSLSEAKNEISKLQSSLRVVEDDRKFQADLEYELLTLREAVKAHELQFEEISRVLMDFNRESKDLELLDISSLSVRLSESLNSLRVQSVKSLERSKELEYETSLLEETNLALLTERDNLSKTNSELSSAIESLEQKLGDLTWYKTNKEAEFLELQRFLSELEGTQSSLRMENEDLQKNLSKALHDHELILGRFSDLQEEHALLNESHERMISEKADVSATNMELKNTILNLERDLAECVNAREEASQAANLIDSLREEIAELQSSLSEAGRDYESLAVELNTKSEEKKSFEKELDDFRLLLEDSQKEQGSLELKYSSLQKAKSQLELQLKDLQSSLDAADDNRRLLESELALAMEKWEKEKVSLHSDLNLEREKQTSLNSENSCLLTEISNLNEQISLVVDERNKFKKILKSAKKQLIDQKQVSDDLFRKNESIISNDAELQRLLIEKNKAVLSLESTVEGLWKYLESSLSSNQHENCSSIENLLKGHISSLEDSAEELRTQLLSAQQAIKVLLARCQRYESLTEQFESRLSSDESATVAALEKKIVELQDQLDAYSSDSGIHQNLAEQNADIQKQLQDKELELEKFVNTSNLRSSEISTLKSRIQELEKQLSAVRDGKDVSLLKHEIFDSRHSNYVSPSSSTVQSFVETYRFDNDTNSWSEYKCSLNSGSHTLSGRLGDLSRQLAALEHSLDESTESQTASDNWKISVSLDRFMLLSLLLICLAAAFSCTFISDQSSISPFFPNSLSPFFHDEL